MHSNIAIVIGSGVGSRIGIYYGIFKILHKWINWMRGRSKHTHNTEQINDKSNESIIYVGFRHAYRAAFLILNSFLLGGLIGGLLSLILTRQIVVFKEIPYNISLKLNRRLPSPNESAVFKIK